MTNRGVETTAELAVGLGWLDGSARAERPYGLLEVVEDTLGADRGDGPKTAWYASSAGYDSGRAAVYWNGRGGAAGTVRVEVKQAALDGLGWAGGLRLADRLSGAGWRPSRLDLYVDDPERRVTPERCRAAVQRGDVVTHARPGQWWTDDQDGRSTYYLGAKLSDRRVRWYDKLDPERTRTELQVRRSSAQHALSAMLAGPDARAAALGALVAFVDFRAAAGVAGGNGRRAPRLDWWQAVVGDVDRLAPAPARPGLSLEERARWFTTYMASMLAELVRALGTEWLQALLSAGMLKLDREGEWAA